MKESIYNEYLNKYYNPNDDNKKPGDNDNWKSIQKGFHSIGSTQLETSEGLTIDKGTENEESLSGTELKHIKTALENIPEDYRDFVDDVTDNIASVSNKVDACEKNVTAKVTALDTLVPFYCEPDDVIVLSTVDGSRFTGSQFRLFDETKTQRTYFGISNSSSPVTKNNPSNKPVTYYASISGGTAQDVIIVNKTKKDAGYELSAAKENIDILTAYVERLEGFNGIISDDVYGERNTISVNSTINSYALTSSGTHKSDSSMCLKRYLVSGGSLVYLKASKESDGICVFQSATDVPPESNNTTIVGNVYTLAIDTIIRVPDGAVCVWISQLKTNSTNIIANIDSTDLPNYYYANNWISDKLADINKKSSMLNGVSFVFITDMHLTNNALRSRALLKKILDKTTVPIVICGGDFAPAKGTQDTLDYTYAQLLEYIAVVGKNKWFAMEGNHDFYVTNDSVTPSVSIKATWAKTYDLIYRNSERWQTSASTEHGCYTIDNDVQKTRFIMLNSCEPDPNAYDTEMSGSGRVTSGQLTWLCNALLEKQNYRIVVFSHIASDSNLSGYSSTQAEVQNVLNAFIAKTSYGSISFAATTNEFICHICGHSHSDGSHDDNGNLSILTTCDAHYSDDGYGATVGTVSEQAFDVYCIDYDTNKINTVRVGRGASREWTKVNGTWTQTV